MLTTLATLAALALMQQTDTTVPVRAGARLEISNFGGEIAVKTWNRNAVRVMAEQSSRDRIRVERSGQVARQQTRCGGRGGARLEMSNFGGDIAVKTVSRNAVRVMAEHSSRDRIRVDASDQVVRVKTEAGRRGPSQIDYAVTVPAWMALNLSGVYTDIK